MLYCSNYIRLYYFYFYGSLAQSRRRKYWG